MRFRKSTKWKLIVLVVTTAVAIDNRLESNTISRSSLQ